MIRGLPYRSHKVPFRAVALSLACFVVPVLSALFLPDLLREAGALPWLIMLIPTFLLAYYQGWRGAASAMAAGVATLALTQVLLTLLDQELPDDLHWMIFAYLGISAGIAWVTELLHRQRADVEDLALTDILTHLPNRRHARIFLENEYSAAERGRPLAVVLFDLDHFKEYNDRYGHQAGDEGLKLFAEILASTTRRMNLSARFGGEEFITILAGSEEEGAILFAERVREALLALPPQYGSLTVSAGVASFHPSMRTADELIAAADLALYRAKQDGRNCVRVFGRPVSLPMPEAEEEEEVFAEEVGGAQYLSRDGYQRASEEIGKSAPPPSLLPSSSGQFGTGRSVLLVDDEGSIRTLISTYLMREGFSVVEAMDAPSAIRELGQEFDIVITDMQLPGLSGNDLTGVVKSRWPMTQVIVITGFRDAQVAAEALNSGADRYLFKPFGMPDLEEHLMGALTRRDRILAERSERIALTEEARRQGNDARETILKGARALVTAVEVRDLYTRGHSMRVADYTAVLGKALNARGEQLDLEALRLACELHDVGKIGIPDAILNKPSPLTAAEFFQVQRHPAIGRRILEPLFGDELILAVTGWHHERWDGEGYPDRLAGESIPLPARLVAFSDTLDAMTSSRAYRSALGWKESVRQIQERGGSQFDPHLMDLFDAALPELEALFREMWK